MVDSPHELLITPDVEHSENFPRRSGLGFGLGFKLKVFLPSCRSWNKIYTRYSYAALVIGHFGRLQPSATVDVGLHSTQQYTAHTSGSGR